MSCQSRFRLTTYTRASDQPGWRVTPYAYLLLKSHGPQVDKLPTLKMDLDFLDTSGFVVLPIQSTAIPIDSAPDKMPRPYEKLAITQTLDERRAEEGKLILELKATAHGLVPPLAEMLDVRVDGFEVTDVEDDGVSVSLRSR